MAPRQRKTTCVAARVGTWIRTTCESIAEVGGSFLGFKEGDGPRERGFKTVGLVTRRVAYFVADHGITAASLSIGVTMKAQGFSLLAMFGALWAFDFVVAGLFVAIYETTGKDFSLGVDFRRAVDTMERKSRLLGFLARLWFTFLAIVWFGPERVVTFFRKEIGTIRRVIVTLVALTAVQSFIWAALYGLAYDLFQVVMRLF